MHKTTSYSQEEIIKSIIDLHVPSGIIDLDPTYSKGNFYKNTGIEKPKYIFDIEPKYEYVNKSCATNLPIEDLSINSIMFDPPFLATTGKSLKGKDGNIIANRFGVFPNEKSLHSFYINSLNEFFRILKPNGILIFKCQDKVSSGKQYFSHCMIHNWASSIGFYPKDMYVLLAKNRVVAKWQLKNQKHARKFHSYFWVFQKRKVKISYV